MSEPVAKTGSCQASRMGYFTSGRMEVVMDDGEEMEYGPGDFADTAPGHDAWIIGNEPGVVIDWQGVGDYATRLSSPGGRRTPMLPSQKTLTRIFIYVEG